MTNDIRLVGCHNCPPRASMIVAPHFHGGAGTLTGSCYRVVHPKEQFVLDCGLFQGNKTLRDLSYRPFPFEPKTIDFLLLTHVTSIMRGLLPKARR
jgi:metallo-beta-lactamase family protein